jgi:hypothetical protein
LPPPLLCIHLWRLETSTVVVYRGCSRFISFLRHRCGKEVSAAAINPRSGAIRFRTAREINTSHSKSNQPSQQELSAFNTAGGSIVPRHSTSNYPSTSKRNQSSPSKRNQPRTAGVTTSLRPASAFSLLLQQTYTANLVVTQPPPALRHPLAKTEGGRPLQRRHHYFTVTTRPKDS